MEGLLKKQAESKVNRTQKLKTVDIKGKKYTEVSERVLFLANNFDYEIETNYNYFETTKAWVVKAILTIHEDGEKRVFHGTAQEVIGDGYINKTSALENCETSAIGRACASAGIGVIGDLASADEMKKSSNNRTTQQEAEIKKSLERVLKHIKNSRKPDELERCKDAYNTLLKSLDENEKNNLILKYEAKKEELTS